jgi:cytochrome c oxidase subunit III
MATTVHQPPKVSPRGGWKQLSGSGGDGQGNGGSPHGSSRAVSDRWPTASKTGVWVGLGAITMSFAALTSALVVRQGSANDWQHVTAPGILYLNTLILLTSSITLELSRRRFAAPSGVAVDIPFQRPLPWLYGTLILGLLFVAGQYLAWLQLRSEGLYLATNPSSSFFYVLTAAHALHVLGGLAGLLYVCAKLRASVLRKNTLDAASHYWHFMGGLWVYLFVLLRMKL